MFTRHFDQVRTQLPHSITVGGVTKTAVVGDVSRTKQDLDAAGYFPEDIFEAHIRVSEWVTLPAIGDQITTTAYPSATFRIVRISTDPSAAVRVLYCGGKA